MEHQKTKFEEKEAKLKIIVSDIALPLAYIFKTVPGLYQLVTVSQQPYQTN